MAAVQFYGKDQVLNAANNIGCTAWAIFAGRAMFMKYEQDDETSIGMLEEALDALMVNGSDAIYTIKFFEIPDGQDKIKINEKSVCTGGSFNFKTLDPQARANRQLGYFGSVQNEEYEKRIKALEAKLQDQDADDEPKSIGALFMDLLQNPSELGQLVNIFRATMGQPVVNFGPASMGSVRTPIPQSNQVEHQEQESEPVTEYKEEDLQRLAKAINTLEKKDSDFLKNIERIAWLAENKPDQYNSAVKILNMQQ